MINYSIVMRSVNANLLEINQAKSRINQAKKDGKEPDKKDTDLVKTEKQNAFAISQYTDVMTIEKFAKHITSHGSVYSRADINAILYMAVDCMREMLLEGKKIRLGDLGDFSILLSSKGAETADKFTAQNITNVKVQWEPGQQFKNLLDEAEFNLVASRSAQAAVIKAIREGKTNVDLNIPETPDGGGDGDGTTGGGTQGGGSNAGGGTQGGGSNAGGSGTTGTEGSGTTGDQGTSGGNAGGEDGGGDNVNF
jgi:predicted histone-like DNA-binding protein